jgi:predicted RNA-binding protein with PIN domain
MERVDWATLPEPVRARLAGVAAAALGDIAERDVPQRLRAVAKFAPAKRARVAAVPMLAALSERGAFRAAVVEWARSHRPEALEPPADDPAAAAAAAVLLDAEDAAALVQAAAERAEESGLRAERDALQARVERLEADVARLRGELAAEREATTAARAERESELERLRERLRERGVELRDARAAAQQARVELEGAGDDAELAELRERLARAQRRLEAERTRAQRAADDAEAARAAVRDARRGDEIRVGLLLDTVAGALDGLRGELGLRAGTPSQRPADSVGGATLAGRTAASVSDAAALDRLLALRGTHLIVDGYNVTKTGYPELPLAAQRDRLVRQLGTVAARTAAEVTVVFDGAGVVAVPAAGVRGVRVLFSDPGVLADDVIKHLVAAEPAGRPLLVATSDREIVDAVRAHGARTMASVVLLERLARV